MENELEIIFLIITEEKCKIWAVGQPRSFSCKSSKRHHLVSDLGNL